MNQKESAVFVSDEEKLNEKMAEAKKEENGKCSCGHNHKHDHECDCHSGYSGQERKIRIDTVPSGSMLVKKDVFKDLKRNDKCPCGSGLKFKKCHLPKLSFGGIYDLKQCERSISNVKIEETSNS
jgi:uncharacterized protein YecA (UPF0149 family)